MKKYCGTCKEVKNKTEFNKNKVRKDGLNSICRVCSKNNSHNYYKVNKEIMKPMINERKRKRKIERIEYIYNYLLENPCVDCGENNPIVLEFDHKDNVEKIGNLCDMISEGVDLVKIKNEINKCDVRCANCHRIRTSKQQNWGMLQFINNMNIKI